MLMVRQRYSGMIVFMSYCKGTIAYIWLCPTKLPAENLASGPRKGL
jgi:hypothetical protein